LISAIEYLKSQGVTGAVIARGLSGERCARKTMLSWD
jgi:hypothetical protein